MKFDKVDIILHILVLTLLQKIKLKFELLIKIRDEVCKDCNFNGPFFFSFFKSGICGKSLIAEPPWTVNFTTDFSTGSFLRVVFCLFAGY